MHGGSSMANWWQVQRLKRGVKGWNRWKRKHQYVEPDLSRADLRGANLSGADLIHANLIRANLSGANLSGAWLNRALLHGLHIVPGGADLSGANLSGAWLYGADLNDANLSEANLMDAKLYRANLSHANLSGANLMNANLNHADLSGANLMDANLSHADLSYAYLDVTLFGGTDLSNAKCKSTVFISMNFLWSKGLAQIEHLGPSVIHLPSLLLPEDDRSLHFLRGVGLTDEQINVWHTTAMLPIQYYSVFISYSSKDEILAHRLHADLQDHGVRCWFAPEDMKIGNKIRDRIDRAIHLQDRSLLLLSDASIASDWVEVEVEAVLERERTQHREILFPVRLDDGVMHTTKAWAATLRRTRHIGDFTTWTDPVAYQSAFDRLLRDLKQN